MRQLRESKFNSVRIEKKRREIIRERGARWYAFECNNGYPRIVESSDMIVPSLRVLCNKVISSCRKAVVQPLDTGTTQLCNHVSLAWQNHEHKTEPIEEGVYNKSSGLHTLPPRVAIFIRGDRTESRTSGRKKIVAVPNWTRNRLSSWCFLHRALDAAFLPRCFPPRPGLNRFAVAIERMRTLFMNMRVAKTK